MVLRMWGIWVKGREASVDHLDGGVGAERDLFRLVVDVLIGLALVVLLDHRLEVATVFRLQRLLMPLLLLL